MIVTDIRILKMCIIYMQVFQLFQNEGLFSDSLFFPIEKFRAKGVYGKMSKIHNVLQIIYI